MKRLYNFSAGPSMLPEWVLRRASEEMLSYHNTGQSVMEMSHRSKEFEEIIGKTEALFRELLNIPSNYKILFLQGGASSQFAMVPLNLMVQNQKADYINTGQWSKKAIAQAKKYGDVSVLASGEDKNFSYIPDMRSVQVNADADYLHITLNNTIYGTCYYELPSTGKVALVADFSSCALSRPLDVSQFGLLYAGAQKNLGPAGLTIVIIKEELIKEPMEQTPFMFTYKIHADNRSLYNTPPTYAIYICGLVLEWIQQEIGGLEQMEKINCEKAAVLYDYLDHSKLFSSTVEGNSRSIMNVPFVTPSKETDAAFISYAKERGLLNLKGHRTVGGMRASIYNAMPLAGVKSLLECMETFEKQQA